MFFFRSIAPSNSTLRSFSSNIISAVSFAISTAVSTEIPTSEFVNAGLSFIPSPIYPTTFPFCFKKAMRDHGLKANQTAILGDQMYTDILGGNIWGFYTILTAPIAIKDRNITKVFRFFEELIYGYLEKKKLLKRGDFDD